MRYTVRDKNGRIIAKTNNKDRAKQVFGRYSIKTKHDSIKPFKEDTKWR